MLLSYTTLTNNNNNNIVLLRRLFTTANLKLTNLQPKNNNNNNKFLYCYKLSSSSSSFDNIKKSSTTLLNYNNNNNNNYLKRYFINTNNNNNRNNNKMAYVSPSEILNLFTKYIPPLNNSMHKGQAGRIAVVGGSQEYTGAPYFAGISSLRIGSDIVHIFAPSEGGTATAIKTLSPELIVHPIDKQMDPSSIIPWLLSIHVLVVGPGLGRSPVAWKCAKEVIRAARNINIPMVLDGDALRLICEDLELIKDYDKVILTPNFVEFRAISDSVKKMINDNSNTIMSPQDMSKHLGNVVIVQKGNEDIITDGESTLVCSVDGMPRRCGGQGDVLAGVIGSMYAWTHLYLKNKSSESSEQTTDINSVEQSLSNISLKTSPTTLAAFAGCAILRQASYRAFEMKRRSTITDDIINELLYSFEKLFPDS